MKAKDCFLSGQPFRIKNDNTNAVYRYEPDGGLLRVISNKSDKIYIVVHICSKGFTIRVFGVITSHPEFISFSSLTEETTTGLKVETTPDFEPEIKTIDQILKNFQTLMDCLEINIILREKTFRTAPEKWRESIKGKDFKKNTSLLNKIDEQLSDWSDLLIYI
jgi:hypothetical protein